jgi:hypothetical protein
MARRLVAALTRALSGPSNPSPHGADPHFHRGAQGNVAACFAPGCDRPRLEV